MAKRPSSKTRKKPPAPKRSSGVSSSVRRILVCPDVHAPFQDELAYATFLAVGHALEPDELVCIGDFADAYSVSRYPKTPERKMSLKTEFNAAKREFARLSRVPAKRKTFCLGNHCERVKSYVEEKAPELDGLVSVDELLGLSEFGWNVVEYQDWVRIGKMAFTHDIERWGVNAARQSLQDFGGNLTFGHTHRGAVVYQGTVDGDSHVCMNVGWLGDYGAIDYRHKAKARREWQHGFGLIHQDASGYSWANFIPILDGRCIVEGKIISGRVRKAA